MTRPNLQTLAAVVFTSAVPLMADAATTVPQPADFDTSPRDGHLSRSEQTRYAAALEAAHAAGAPAARVENALVELDEEQEQAAGRPIPVEDLVVSSEERDCAPPQGFYLRKTVADLALTGCDSYPVTSQPATFAFVRDRENADRAFDLSFGLAIPIGPDPQPRGSDRELGFLSLTDYGFALYAEGQGRTGSAASDYGKLDAGLRFDMSFEGNTALSLTLSTSVFARHYFAGDGRAYGATVAVRPQYLPWRINAAPGEKSRPNRNTVGYVTSLFRVEALHVEDAGDTGLDDGDEHAWLIADLGYVFEHDGIGPHGARFGIGVQYAKDALSDRDATLWSAGASLYLDEKKHTALSLNWREGKDYSSFQDEDTITFGLGLKF